MLVGDVANAYDRFIVDSHHVKKTFLWYNFNKDLTTIIVIKLRKKENKNEKRDDKRTRIDHMTEQKERQNFA